jgi:hypothetical protein
MNSFHPLATRAGLISNWRSCECSACHETVVVETLCAYGERYADAPARGDCPLCGSAGVFVVPGVIRGVHIAGGLSRAS